MQGQDDTGPNLKNEVGKVGMMWTSPGGKLALGGGGEPVEGGWKEVRKEQGLGWAAEHED